MIKCIFRLVVVILSALPLVHCGSNRNTVPDSAPQSSSVTLQSAAIQDMIKGLFTNVLGRQPTAAEIENAIALLKAGLTNTGLQQQLATSAESIWNITVHLIQTGLSGVSLQTTIDQWVTQLAAGKTLQQLLTGT